MASYAHRNLPKPDRLLRRLWFGTPTLPPSVTGPRFLRCFFPSLFKFEAELSLWRLSERKHCHIPAEILCAVVGRTDGIGRIRTGWELRARRACGSLRIRARDGERPSFCSTRPFGSPSVSGSSSPISFMR
ncbi:hypothetical protein BHM03_00057256 [Ensete ventricosum]|nr:hypothetical protein BHM03_00057256 [Ensete ventricosum]